MKTEIMCLGSSPHYYSETGLRSACRSIDRYQNASLQTGVFPTVLKKEVAYPSLKKSKRDYEQYSSYQYPPITNIAFLSKTIERIAATQTMNYLAVNDHKDQSLVRYCPLFFSRR